MYSQKVFKTNPQSKLYNHIISQTAQSNKTDTIPFHAFPGISRIRNKISNLIVHQLENRANSLFSKNILLRGLSGCGKTFLAESICFSFDCVLLLSSFEDLAVNISQAKGKNKVILVTGVDNVEDKGVIENLSSVLRRNKDVLVIGEARGEVDKVLRKFGCFEEEIVFPLLDYSDRLEILAFLAGKNGVAGNEWLEYAAHSTPGFNPSDLCIFYRRILVQTFLDKNIAVNQIINNITKKDKSSGECISLNDIGGLDKVKEELNRSIMQPILHPKRYEKLNIKMSRGVLLYGAPGCGKTMIAKAVSTETCANFISIKGPELVSKYVGDTESKLREVFERAKNCAPCIIFFDEFDSLSQRRNSNSNDRVVNQLLTLMDGFESRNQVYVIAATNRLDAVDGAFLRPGRFDKIIEVPLPDYASRKEIFENRVKKLDIALFDCSLIISKTEGWNGAEIANIVEEACLTYLHANNSDDCALDERYFFNAFDEICKGRIK